VLRVAVSGWVASGNRPIGRRPELPTAAAGPQGPRALPWAGMAWGLRGPQSVPRDRDAHFGRTTDKSQRSSLVLAMLSPELDEVGLNFTTECQVVARQNDYGWSLHN